MTAEWLSVLLLISSLIYSADWHCLWTQHSPPLNCIVETFAYKTNVAFRSEITRVKKIWKCLHPPRCENAKNKTHWKIIRAHYDWLLKNSSEARSQFVKTRNKYGKMDFLWIIIPESKERKTGRAEIWERHLERSLCRECMGAERIL